MLKLVNAPPATQPFLFGHFIKGMVGFSCFSLHSNVLLGNAAQAKRLTGCVSRLLAVFALDPFASSCWGASWGSRRVRWAAVSGEEPSRGTGLLGGWPAHPALCVTPWHGTSLTCLSP